MHMAFRLAAAGISLALAACATPTATPAPTAEQCPLDGATADHSSEHFDSMVHDYLIAHPEVLIEMSQALREKQQAAAQEKARQGIVQNRAALYSDPADPVAGNPSGTITVVEFFDAECPFCKRLAPDLQRLIAENKGVRLVYKEFPILGPGSVTAAKAALASIRQGKYEAFHNALMADATPEHQLTEAHIMEIAKSVGLDTVRLKADMASPEVAAKIYSNRALAQALGVTATPGLVIGDRMVAGALPYPALLQAIDEARNTAQADGPR